MQVHAKCCSRWHSYMSLSSQLCPLHTTSAQSPRWVGTPPCARANPPCPQWRRKRVVANPAPAWRRPKWSPNVVLLAHVLPTHVVSPNVASKRGVTCSRGVRQPWGRQMWHQNVASLAHAASGSQVALPEVASVARVASGSFGVARCGIKAWRHLLTCCREPGHVVGIVPRFTPMASPGITGSGVTCSRGVREPRGVPGRGVRTWRQAPRRNAASGGPDLLARVFKVFSVVGRFVHPHRQAPLAKIDMMYSWKPFVGIAKLRTGCSKAN